MNVYTHYRTLSPTVGFRWRTLLQFGDGWEVIGSVVMKNQGSAYFANEAPITDTKILAHLQPFDDESEPLPWYEFKADPTMFCIRDLFGEYVRIQRKQELSGVIQIFNLFYIQDAVLKDALQKQQSHRTEDLLDYDIRHLVAPVYLGFAELARDPQYHQAARRFFNAARALGMNCWEVPMECNAFYHPLYLIRHGKNNPRCKLERERFVSDAQMSLFGEKFWRSWGSIR